jgi:hypothetical protein
MPARRKYSGRKLRADPNFRPIGMQSRCGIYDEADRAGHCHTGKQAASKERGL